MVNLTRWALQILSVTALASMSVQNALAQHDHGVTPPARPSWQPMSLTQAPPQSPTKTPSPSGTASKQGAKGTGAPVDVRKGEFNYKEVSDFFNIREANANVRKGEWEYEQTLAWATYRHGRGQDDDFFITESLKYGITNDFYVELEVLPINLGDGADIGRTDLEDGTGETAFIAFWQFLHETGLGLSCPPAMAVWGELRIPTGESSSKVDGTLHLTVTKTLCPGWRAHIDGFIETANGSRGQYRVIEDRRNFQWGIGPGVDYEINACNLVTLNYLNSSSDAHGNRNNNIVEAGWVYKISEHQVLKFAVDSELHQEAEGPHWQVKAQYGIDW